MNISAWRCFSRGAWVRKVRVRSLRKFPEKPTNRYFQPIYFSSQNIWSISQPIYLPHHIKLNVRNLLLILNNTVQHVFNGKPIFLIMQLNFWFLTLLSRLMFHRPSQLCYAPWAVAKAMSKSNLGLNGLEPWPLGCPCSALALQLSG